MTIKIEKTHINFTWVDENNEDNYYLLRLHEDEEGQWVVSFLDEDRNIVSSAPAGLFEEVAKYVKYYTNNSIDQIQEIQDKVPEQHDINTSKSSDGSLNPPVIRFDNHTHTPEAARSSMAETSSMVQTSSYAREQDLKRLSEIEQPPRQHFVSPINNKNKTKSTNKNNNDSMVTSDGKKVDQNDFFEVTKDELNSTEDQPFIPSPIEDDEVKEHSNEDINEKQEILDRLQNKKQTVDESDKKIKKLQ